MKLRDELTNVCRETPPKTSEPLTTHKKLEIPHNAEFYVLLTVHLDAILGNDQLDALFLNVFIYASTCFEQRVLIIRRSKLY
jgi:hypothetical protein